MKEYSFIEDKEKMKDFLKLDKLEFLKSYSYILEEEYDATVEIYIRRTRESYERTFLKDNK